MNDLRTKFDKTTDHCLEMGLTCPVLKPGSNSGWSIYIDPDVIVVGDSVEEVLIRVNYWLNGYVKAKNDYGD